MNQTCKVCGEPAAGFHFGAFTCEGCKSFFGRSYNNLASISECKNNGECVINKKNRTACKACRLRKCLLVGMSKSGSRYGRRSNWFKIHCLLQEQQQAAAAAQGNQKTPPPQGMSMLGHSGGYPPGYPLGRPPCTKEELMLLGLEDFHKHASSASPSVSSPDSHNSDSSIEVGDRRNSMLRQNKIGDGGCGQNNGNGVGGGGGIGGGGGGGIGSGGGGNNGGGHHHHHQQISKELFLPLPFAGLSSLPVMPPPGFLPPSHLLFSGYHPALYPHHQGLLKPTSDASMLASAALVANNNSRFTPNHNKTAEELTKRFYLDAVLKSQRSPSNCTAKSEEEEVDTEDMVATMTPPRSPTTITTTLTTATASITTAIVQENPIDLSMKASEGSLTLRRRHDSASGDSDNISMDDEHCGGSHRDSAGRRHQMGPAIGMIAPEMRMTVSSVDGDHNDHAEYEREVKRKKFQGTTPLDLTTKV